MLLSHLKECRGSERASWYEEARHARICSCVLQKVGSCSSAVKRTLKGFKILQDSTLANFCTRLCREDSLWFPQDCQIGVAFLFNGLQQDCVRCL